MSYPAEKTSPIIQEPKVRPELHHSSVKMARVSNRATEVVTTFTLLRFSLPFGRCHFQIVLAIIISSSVSLMNMKPRKLVIANKSASCWTCSLKESHWRTLLRKKKVIIKAETPRITRMFLPRRRMSTRRIFLFELLKALLW